MSPLVMIILFTVVVPAVFYFGYKMFSDGKAKAFLEANPDAAKIFIGGLGLQGIHAVSIEIHSVDGEDPLTFMDGMRSGVYVTKGSHILEVSATATRPGIMHKSVAKTYGPLKLEVTAEMYKTYELSFDLDAGNFNFVEKS